MFAMIAEASTKRAMRERRRAKGVRDIRIVTRDERAAPSTG
jgi:hypothetical protein